MSKCIGYLDAFQIDFRLKSQKRIEIFDVGGGGSEVAG